MAASEAGGVDLVDVGSARSVLDACAALASAVAPSGRRIDAGGMFASALANSEATGLGAVFDPAAVGGSAGLFAEHRCGALLEVPPEHVSSLSSELEPLVVGRITDAGTGVRLGAEPLSTDEVVLRWRTAFEDALDRRPGGTEARR
ncbi:MAG: hypothetical protein R2698_10215 [Microthrixaceae bacterium]